jgi:hypothetical protein
MRHAAAAYHLLSVNDETAGDARAAEHARQVELAREASPAPTLRQRAGAAVIALGVRLAGDRAASTRQEPRLVPRAS